MFGCAETIVPLSMAHGKNRLCHMAKTGPLKVKPHFKLFRLITALLGLGFLT